MAEAAKIYRLTLTSEGKFKDRGSTFFSFAIPVENEEEVAKEVEALKKKFHDARHHCYAYRLGRDGEKTYATDDGEPSHSAGTPILGAIRSFELTNTLVVGVRYVGGTKLGIRGLIEAYRSAAEKAIKANQREEIIEKVFFSITFAYEQTSEVNRLLHPHPTRELEANYTEICRQTFSIRKVDFPPLENSLNQSPLQWKVIEEA